MRACLPVRLIVTFSLALDATTITNGCIRYLPGSGRAKTLRLHKPLLSTDTSSENINPNTNSSGSGSGSSGREESHAVAAEVREDEEEQIRYAQVPRLSASMHDEWVVHGSGETDLRARRGWVRGKGRAA